MMNKVTAEMIAKVKELQDDPYREYDYYGIRVQEVPFEQGKITHNSFVWVDGEITEEELNGVCAIRADNADYIKRYFGEYAAIIAGNKADYGYDPGEIIIEDANVIEIL